MLHTVRSMLTDNDFVHLFSFDFSKAYDTVRHATLMSKLAQLELPDSIYNWVVDFLKNHAHCTKYTGQVSTVAVIQACIIQGSAIGPASYVVTAADLHPVHDRNRIFKFADVQDLLRRRKWRQPASTLSGGEISTFGGGGLMV